jgi:hypothetical protein
VVISANAQADMMIADIDNSTLVDVYNWDNDKKTDDTNDTNPDFVSPNNEKIEERWLEALLGLTYNDSSINLLGKYEVPKGVNFSFPYTPAWDFDYAIVKIGNAGGNDDHYAFYDTDGNNVLNNLVYQDGSSVSFANGVSHITFFSGPSNQVPVPEPASMLLVGTGLIGLLGLVSVCPREDNTMN